MGGDLVPGLTSLVLVCLLAGLVALLLGGLLWGWPRLARPGWQSIVLRVIALCVVQASLISLIFVVVNRVNDFYSSWTDLFGGYTGGGVLVAIHHGAVASDTPLSILASAPVVASGGRLGGTLEVVRIRGRLSGLTDYGHIYLPPGYPKAVKAGQSGGRYPVIVVISAAQDSAISPYSARFLATDAANEIAARRLKPVILVMLPPGPGQDLGCLNLPGGAQAALFFAQDLPAAVGSRYQVGTGLGGWALLGDSSGGYCALQLALTNATTFGAAAIPAGRYQSPPGPAPTTPLFGTQDNVVWLLQHQPMQPISVLFTEPGQAQPPLSLIHRPMRATTARLTSGPSALAPVLDWLGSALNSAPGS